MSYLAGKHISISKVRSLNRLLTLLVPGFLSACFALGRQPAGQQETEKRAIQDAYDKHDLKICHVSPPYSGPPLAQVRHNHSLRSWLRKRFRRFQQLTEPRPTGADSLPRERYGLDCDTFRSLSAIWA